MKPSAASGPAWSAWSSAAALALARAVEMDAIDRFSRLNVDFPSWVVQGLDRQAQRLGVMRQGLIKPLIAARLG